MRVPLGWLADDVTLPAGITADEVADALVRVGFETEDVHHVPPTAGALVVGHVLSIEELTGFKKPIRFCTVDCGPGHGPDGSDEPRGIICGARNFVEGDKVVVALPGAVLPGDFEIATRPTYGRISDGMICSARELGIGTDHDGILVLDGDAQVGSDARQIVGADDAVIELAITADRGYALSIRGLARETGAALGVPYVDVAATGTLPDRAEGGWPVHIEDPQGCQRFVTVRISGINPAAPSPYWMRKRVQQAGIRSISLAVDITNYVMIAYGQPLHAFDAAALTGDIRVRRAAAGEKLKTLDGSVRVLDPTDLVVTDDTGPISMAGVMGGESTEISDRTTEVLIEAAWWDPATIYRTARRHKLPSEASRRFERGVDPQIQAIAAEAAAELLVRYGGGVIVGRSDVGTTIDPQPITLPLTEPSRLAGREYTPEQIAHRLTQIGATVGEVESGAVTVIPPSWRPDLTRPADLVEEVARLEDYDTIPSILPVAPAGTGLTARQRRHRAVGADLAAAGLVESLSFPFVGPADFDALGLAADDVRRSALSLLNPLDSARPQLATTLLPGLLDTAVRNISRGAKDLALYEIGQVFLPSPEAPAVPELPTDHRPDDAALAVADASLPAQPRHVAAVLVGHAESPGWWGTGRLWTWADAVELARRVGAVAGTTLRVSDATQMPWHPGRCARLSVGDFPVGYAGELHPQVCEQLSLPPRTAAFELDLDLIPEPALAKGRSVSAFPPVNLDLAVVVSQDTPAASVVESLIRGGGELLESVRLFDVYTGDQVPVGHKSLAFALVVRAADRTLTAAEALQVRDAALASATDATGAVLRG